MHHYRSEIIVFIPNTGAFKYTSKRIVGNENCVKQVLSRVTSRVEGAAFAPCRCTYNAYKRKRKTICKTELLLEIKNVINKFVDSFVSTVFGEVEQM